MTGQLSAPGASSPRLFAASRRRKGEGVGEGDAADYGSVLAPAGSGLRTSRPTSIRTCACASQTAGPQLFFRDTRKFGKVQLLRAGEASARIDKLGIDALAATGETLFAATRKRGQGGNQDGAARPVRAGWSRQHLRRRSAVPVRHPSDAACPQALGQRTASASSRAAQRVMLRSIETGGSSISDYIQPNGSDGGYQDERRVYARGEVEPCLTCGARIRRIVIGQRSAHYCPRCQS